MALKFKFSRKKIRRSPTPFKKYRFARTLPKKFAALERNIELDLFGEFTDNEKPSLSSRLFERVKQLAKRAFAKIKRIPRRSAPPMPTSLLFGAACGSVFLLGISAFLSLILLFGSYGGRYTEVEIPDLISLNESDALAVNEDIFEYVVTYRSNPDASEGKVISQSPSPSVVRRLYSKSKKIRITLTVNRKSEALIAPETIGLSLRDASLLLKNSGLRYKIVSEYSTAPSGTVIDCSHNSGQAVSEKDTVILHTSIGQKKIYKSVPSLIGFGENEAVEKLTAASFKVGKISYAASEKPLGTVITQEYRAGEILEENTEIDLTVSGGTGYSDN